MLLTLLLRQDLFSQETELPEASSWNWKYHIPGQICTSAPSSLLWSNCKTLSYLRHAQQPLSMLPVQTGRLGRACKLDRPQEHSYYSQFLLGLPLVPVYHIAKKKNSAVILQWTFFSFELFKLLTTEQWWRSQTPSYLLQVQIWSNPNLNLTLSPVLTLAARLKHRSLWNCLIHFGNASQPPPPHFYCRFGPTLTLKLFLIGWTVSVSVSLPNLVQTVWRTILHFWTEPQLSDELLDCRIWFRQFKEPYFIS